MLLVDTPIPGVRRLTLNRPEKRNALNNELRGAIFKALEAHDGDTEVKVTIIRGAGPAFCSGYDLSADNRIGQPYHSAAGLGQWSRPCRRGLVQGLGSRQAGDRPGPWLLPRRRHRARDRLRSRLRRGGCADRLSAGAP
jgi:hypothetical protein